MPTVRSLNHRVAALPTPALVAIAAFLTIGIVGPWLAPFDPVSGDLLSAVQPADSTHWLGTDHIGRDLLSRLIVAARTSLVGIALVLLSALTIGILIGAVAGFFRGTWIDELLMRIVDVGLSLPSLIVTLAVIGILGQHDFLDAYWLMILALSLAWWPSYARLSRAVVVSVASQPHIEALRVLGATPARILFRHMLPSAIGSVLVYASADAGAIALSIATLSFLGLGVPPPTPEWGQMLVDGLPYLEEAPLLVLAPGLALTMVVVGFNMLGESVALSGTPRPLSNRALRTLRRSLHGGKPQIAEDGTDASGGSANQTDRGRHAV